MFLVLGANEHTKYKTSGNCRLRDVILRDHVPGCNEFRRNICMVFCRFNRERFDSDHASQSFWSGKPF